MADQLRQNIHKHGHTSNVDVMTIAQFMERQLRGLDEGPSLLERKKGKADLMLHLSIAWKHQFENAPPEIFFQAFNLFTELRSFTLNIEVAQEVLGEFDPIVAKAIETFWRVCDKLRLIDEHTSYDLVAKVYSGPAPLEKQNYVLWGFDHLSTGQIHLFESIALQHHVSVPFPQSVAHEVKETDWPYWIGPFGKFSPTPPSGDVCRVVSFPKNHLNHALSSLLPPPPPNALTKKDIFLAQKNPSIDQLAKVYLPGQFFKAKTDLIAPQIWRFIQEFKERCGPKNADVNVMERIHKLLKEEKENFLAIKGLLLLKKAIENWRELSRENRLITKFDWQILEQVALLNCPRIFFAPLSSGPGPGPGPGQIQGLEGLEGFDPQAQTLLCFTSDYWPLKDIGHHYSETVLEFLSALGPVRRSELGYKMLQARLVEILDGPHSFLFIEEGLAQRDGGLDDILSCFARVEKRGAAATPLLLNKKKLRRFKGDVLKDHQDRQGGVKKVSPNQNWSASKIQAYVDCPRKFYFQYLDNLELHPAFKEHLHPRQLGTLEHGAIQKYWEKASPAQTHGIDKKELHHLVETELDYFCQEEEVTLSPFEKRRSLMEIVHRAQVGIETLLSFKRWDSHLHFSFEYPLSAEERDGHVDCLIEANHKGEGQWGLVDFKRSSFSIPAKGELERREVIQLWFYLAHVGKPLEECFFFGHVDLSDPQGTQLFSTKESLAKDSSFKSICEYIPLAKLEEQIQGHHHFERDLLSRLIHEEDFPPHPRKTDICHYCFLSSLCSRGYDRVQA